MVRRYDLDTASFVAVGLSSTLAPACHRIEIAGSIRRRVSFVKDIEIVAVPLWDRDLWGTRADTTPLDLVLARLAEDGRLVPRDVIVNRADGSVERQRRMGDRYKALVAVRSGIPVDLFLPQSDEEWGACLAIRTGPGEYSKMLVTEALRRGLRCSGNLVRDQATGKLIPTPTEEAFFAAVGVPWVKPEARHA